MRLEEMAFSIARIVHRDQQYAGYPYTVHLSAMVDIVARYDINPYVIAAAWLHDAPEDTHYSVEAIRRDFGTQVAELVEAVTGYGENRKQKQASIRAKLMYARPEASIIKAADRIANVQFSTRSGARATASMYLKEELEFLKTLNLIPPALYLELLQAHRDADEFLQSSAPPL